MLRYTKDQEKVMVKYQNLKTEAERLEEFLQTEEFSKLSAEDRSEKVMNLHYMKQNLMELLEETTNYTPEVVPDEPTKPLGLGEGIEPKDLN